AGASITLKDSIVEAVADVSGGALFLYDATAELAGGIYLGPATYGGAIYVEGGTLITRSSGEDLTGISGFAYEYGGGVYADAGSTLDLDGTLLEDSFAVVGGGVFLQSAEMTATKDVWFQRNGSYCW